MTSDELNELKTIMENRIREITDSMPYLEQETKPIEPSVSLGRLTRMEAIADKSVNEHVLSQNRLTLEKLKNAFRRIERGEYGKCIRCGGEIPIGRLRIVPEALVCVPCSEKKSR